ncbi:type II CAAX prenyl endopeptidase Rce1 family protein [Halobaculum litoreum]|uniref:Type II CAAX prenyl endopeptidase Rce1 family protein n=1 Tax=Halobaculum litoreum TaxID=3031998 RepID=A0ABD5XVI1_9EURY
MAARRARRRLGPRGGARRGVPVPRRRSGRLRRAFGPVGAVAGASLLFGSLHLANYTGALAAVVVGVLLIAVVGSVFGALYERTGNLATAVIAHGVYNAVLFLGSYVAM